MPSHPHLKELILVGVTMGLLTETASASDNDHQEKLSLYEQMKQSEGGNFGYHLMTEEELLLELNQAGADLYYQLTPAGKRLARIVASQRCDGRNPCKGLNACRTDKNDCAGQGACRGQGKCSTSDKNLAIKLVTKKLATERAKVLGSPTQKEKGIESPSPQLGPLKGLL